MECGHSNVCSSAEGRQYMSHVDVQGNHCQGNMSAGQEIGGKSTHKGRMPSYITTCQLHMGWGGGGVKGGAKLLGGGK